MKTYTIAVQWVMTGEYKIEASNLKEAIEKSFDLGLPQGQYLGGSCQVNEELTAELNSEEQSK